jgi:predicted transcriptional regulator
MSSTTLSIRVPLETRRWLDRFAKKRGSAGSAATRILEEARRREDFPAVEFRDTPLGRVAYVQGTRVQVAFAYDQVRRDPSLTPDAVAASFAWPRWKAAGVMAYLEAFPDECRREWEDFTACNEQVLKRSLPHLEQKEVEVL